MIRAALPIISMLMAGPSATMVDTIAERAVTCRLSTQEVAVLPKLIRRHVADATASVRYTAMPSGDLYRTARPIAALGYVAREIYIAPARIVLVVDEPLEKVAHALALQPSPLSPWSKPAGDDRSLIAYQLHHDALKGRTLVGCEYRDPVAAAWLDEGSL